MLYIMLLFNMEGELKKIIVFVVVLSLLLMVSCTPRTVDIKFNKVVDKTPVDPSIKEKTKPKYRFENLIDKPKHEVGQNSVEIIVNGKSAQKIEYPYIKGKKAFNNGIKKYIYSTRDSILKKSDAKFNEIIISYETFKPIDDYYSVKVYYSVNEELLVNYLVFSDKSHSFVKFDQLYNNDAKEYLNQKYDTKLDYKNFLYLNDGIHFLSTKIKDIVVKKSVISAYKRGGKKKEIELVHISNMHKVDPSKPMVALTFDDGPHPEYTDKIVDCLNENESNATFFVLGRSIKAFKGVVRRTYLAGNDIGNHSYSHPELTFQSNDEVESQIVETDKLIKGEIDKNSYYFRPPYGAFNRRVINIVKKPIILWDVDTLDWKYKDADRVYDFVLDNMKDGSIVLMHDIHETTLEASLKLIPEIKKRGYQIVSLSQLEKYKKIKIKKGKVYTDLCK